jgi:hypothetical protein
LNIIRRQDAPHLDAVTKEPGYDPERTYHKGGVQLMSQQKDHGGGDANPCDG